MAEEKSANTYGGAYGKRPLWQWIVLYAVVAGVLYGVVYYFVFAKNGYAAPSTSAGATAPAQQTPAY